MRISLVHTRGRVGKTTNAIMLATAAARRGIDGDVRDAGPHRSATRGAEVASMRELERELLVRGVDARRLERYAVSALGQLVHPAPGTDQELHAATDIAVI